MLMLNVVEAGRVRQTFILRVTPFFSVIVQWAFGGMFSGFLSYKTIPIIKGDSRSLSIAAASIVAKVTRDGIMRRYDEKYPLYGFSKHKGYGTRFHFEAIERYGPCPLHRKSFAPIKNKL